MHDSSPNYCTGMTSYDLDKPRQRMGLYRTVLHEGLHDALPRYLNQDPAPPAVAGAAHPRGRTARRMGRRLPPARLPRPGSRVTDMPELHTRLMADVIALGSPYPLVLTGGYAVRAHRLVNRPSQDLDVATENLAPYYKLRNVHSTLVAGVAQSSTANGAAVVQ